jgi:hypothetical protein
MDAVVIPADPKNWSESSTSMLVNVRVHVLREHDQHQDHKDDKEGESAHGAPDSEAARVLRLGNLILIFLITVISAHTVDDAVKHLKNSSYKAELSGRA